MLTDEDILAAWGSVQTDMQDDRTLVPHLYTDKRWTIARISEHTGLHRSTIYRRLVAAGAYEGRGVSGPPRSPTCARGHDMEVHGRELAKGGRICTECKRIRERVSHD